MEVANKVCLGFCVVSRSEEPNTLWNKIPGASHGNAVEFEATRLQLSVACNMAPT